MFCNTGKNVIFKVEIPLAFRRVYIKYLEYLWKRYQVSTLLAFDSLAKKPRRATWSLLGTELLSLSPQQNRVLFHRT